MRAPLYVSPTILSVMSVSSGPLREVSRRGRIETAKGAGVKPVGNRAFRLLGPGFPLRAQGVMEALTNPAGKREELAVTVEFNGLLRGVENHLAVMATFQMSCQHLSQFIVQVSIQIARNLLECIFTVHECLTSFKELAQFFTEAQPGPEKAGLYRTLGQVENFRRLLSGKTFHVAEEKDLPKRHGKRARCGLQNGFEFRALELLLRIGPPIGEILRNHLAVVIRGVLHLHFFAAAAFAELHQPLVDGNAHDPRVKAGVFTEFRQMLECLQESFLKHVLGILRIAREIQAKTIDFFLVAVDKLFKGSIIAGLRLRNKEGFFLRKTGLWEICH